MRVPLALGFVLQTVAVKMVTEVVTVPVKRTTSVLVVEVVTMSNSTGAANGTTFANGTGLGSNGTSIASLGLGTMMPLYTATG